MTVKIKQGDKKRLHLNLIFKFLKIKMFIEKLYLKLSEFQLSIYIFFKVGLYYKE